MGDDDACTPFAQGIECTGDQGLTLSIETAGGFIEYENRRIL